MISSIISRLVILVFGTLYPAYASYKAVRTKNLKEYVKWMMYWIVFALFTCTETFTDVFLSWFPFYYEVKIVLVLWLLSPATKGSSILYRKFVHPALCRREQEIDEYIAKAKDQGYHTVLNLGTKGVNYATTVIMQTAIKNFNLPSPGQDSARVRRAIEARDVTDGFHDYPYDDLEYQRSEDNLQPGIVEIVELDAVDNNQDFSTGDGDANDPDYDPENTSARSRGNVIRKRKVVKEKRSRSKSKGRRTRSQAAVEKESEIMGGGGLVQQLRKSYSLSDLTECEPREERGADEADDVLAEPRLIKRGAKSGFSTRRSASESNSRQPLYFPEVDVDVRGPRPNRMDEPDFSHIKSSEDISSGYSSADNSASLTRAGSLGASGRARARTSKTTVTPIKRPQAAEENEVINEELHDNDTFEYANMPPLVTLKSPLYLSHTDPPFLYQYIGDQVKIVQVLGNFPFQTDSNSINNNTDYRDQKEIATKEASLSKKILTDFNETAQNDKLKNVIDDKVNTVDFVDDQAKAQKEGQVQTLSTELSDSTNGNGNQQKTEIKLCAIDLKHIEENIGESLISIEKDNKQNGSIDNLYNVIESAESDDEASFGTPDNSPRYKRKLKGKYGKPKAPLPPKAEDEIIKAIEDLDEAVTALVVSEENLSHPPTDVNLSENDLSDGSLFENRGVEKKQRHKSKSPVRNSIMGSSSISRLLQLPAKLVFWNKNEESQKLDESSSSGSNSRRSSITTKTADEFESCSDLNVTTSTSTHVISIPQIEITNVETTSKKETCIENDNANQDIGELNSQTEIIESKSQNNSEYKYIPLHDNNEIAPTSKSTDV